MWVTAAGAYIEFAVPVVAPPPTIPPYVLENICGYAETYRTREKWRTLADGAVWVDRLNTSSKRDFRLDFCNITTAQKDTIGSAFGKVITDNGTATYTSPANLTYTVTVHPQQPGLSWEATDSLGTLYWTGSMMLREV